MEIGLQKAGVAEVEDGEARVVSKGGPIEDEGVKFSMVKDDS